MLGQAHDRQHWRPRSRVRGVRGRRFRAVIGGARLASTLKCSACDASYTYLQLIDQIGEEAMRRANKGLDDLQKKPPR
jgi:hypothetical protein